MDGLHTCEYTGTVDTCAYENRESLLIFWQFTSLTNLANELIKLAKQMCSVVL